jgi:hypothetical protein
MDDDSTGTRAGVEDVEAALRSLQISGAAADVAAQLPALLDLLHRLPYDQDTCDRIAAGAVLPDTFHVFRRVLEEPVSAAITALVPPPSSTSTQSVLCILPPLTLF